MPKVSVIIPVYNVEKYLSECLDSVINQTLKDIEIICINDGSTDASGAILDEYAKKDKRIKVFSQKNKGLSVTRNSGLQKSTGDLVYFLDSDDYISPYTLEYLINALIKDNSDIALGHVKCFGDVSADILESKQHGFDYYEKKTGVYKIGLDVRKEMSIISCNKLYRKSIIDQFEIRFPEGLINEDEYWLWAYLIHCNTYSFVDENLYFYLQRPSSIMGQRSKSLKMLDILDIDCLIYDVVKKYKDITVYKKILAELFISRILYLYPSLPSKYYEKYLYKIKNYYKYYNNSLKIKRIHQWLSEGKDPKLFLSLEKSRKAKKSSFFLFGFIPLLKIEEA